jgi:hypothetical protein
MKRLRVEDDTVRVYDDTVRVYDDTVRVYDDTVRILSMKMHVQQSMDMFDESLSNKQQELSDLRLVTYEIGTAYDWTPSYKDFLFECVIAKAKRVIIKERLHVYACLRLRTNLPRDICHLICRDWLSWEDDTRIHSSFLLHSKMFFRHVYLGNSFKNFCWGRETPQDCETILKILWKEANKV